MSKSEKRLRIAVTVVVALIVCGAGVVIYMAPSSEERPDPTGLPSIRDIAGKTGLARPAAPREAREKARPARRETRSASRQLPTIARAWDYDGCVIADRLPLTHVSKIPAGMLIDATTGRVLWSKHSKKQMEIASMTKMMTALVAMDAVRQGEIHLHSPVVVSADASRIGGSQVYLKEGEQFSLEELLKSILIVSANDSSHLVAEAVAGDVDRFVKKMNARAKSLGMNDTRFYNPHGLPLKGPDNVSTAYDMALLADALRAYPQVYEWAGTWLDYFRDGTFMMANHNKLLKKCDGVDGLKTGYYSDAGFCVTATATRKGRRLIAVVIGVKSKNVRNAFTADLIDWGYRRLGKDS